MISTCVDRKEKPYLILNILIPVINSIDQFGFVVLLVTVCGISRIK